MEYWTNSYAGAPCWSNVIKLDGQYFIRHIQKLSPKPGQYSGKLLTSEFKLLPECTEEQLTVWLFVKVKARITYRRFRDDEK